MDKKFLKECFLQKTNQYDALDLLINSKEALKLGSELVLDFKEVEAGKHKVVAKTKDGGKIVGILSEEDEKEVKPYLEVGRTDLFLCRISKYDEKGDENKRFSIAIFIKSKEEAEKRQSGKKH